MKQKVKDKVHYPDWTNSDRLAYTMRLFDILSELLPFGLDGGVSTSPISYRWWHKDDSALENAKILACDHLADLMVHLVNLKTRTGKKPARINTLKKPESFPWNSACLFLI